MTTILLLIGLAVLDETEHLSSGWTVDVRAIWTAFDDDLRIEHAPGVGVEVGSFDWNHGGPVGFRIGMYVWETENEDDETRPADVHVRQYFVGFWMGHEEGIFELEMRLDLGAIAYSGGGSRDTALMVQYGLDFGLILHKHLKLDFFPALVFSQSDFNRGSEHATIHRSANLGLSLRF